MSTPDVHFHERAAVAGSQDELALKIWLIGSFCIFGWDCLMCLYKEIKYIWRKRLNLVSVLYLTNRYLGLIQGAVGIWLVEALQSDPTALTCNKLVLWQTVGAMFLILLSHLLVAGRVYTLYGRSQIILGLLVTIITAEFVVHAYNSTIVPLPLPLEPGTLSSCVAHKSGRWFVAFWALPFLFDTTTFALGLLITYTVWREEVNTQAITLIFRDGLVYFAATFLMNIVNFVLFMTQEAHFQMVNLPATVMLNIIMSCRLVLNVRGQCPETYAHGMSAFTEKGPRVSGWDRHTGCSMCDSSPIMCTATTSAIIGEKAASGA